MSKNQAPRRPLSIYLRFRLTILKQFEWHHQPEKIAQTFWHNISFEEMQRYKKQYEQEQRLYLEDLKIWQEKQNNKKSQRKSKSKSKRKDQKTKLNIGPFPVIYIGFDEKSEMEQEKMEQENNQ